MEPLEPVASRGVTLVDRQTDGQMDRQTEGRRILRYRYVMSFADLQVSKAKKRG